MAEFDNISLLDRDQRRALIARYKEFSDTPAPLGAEHIRSLLSFENKLYAAIKRDKGWFFGNVGKSPANDYARDMNVLHRMAAKSIEHLFSRRGEWSVGDDDPMLRMTIAFALFHHVASVKWYFFRHEPVKPTLWPAVHELYKFASEHRFALVPLTLFDDEPDQKTTVSALYIRALMLEVLNTGSMTMPQVEIADGWLAEWTPDYAIDDHYSPRSHALFVDLEAMSGLQLVTGTPPKPSYRYLRLDGIKEQIDAVRTQLRVGNPYFGRGIKNMFAMEEYVALLAMIERLYTTLLQASASRIEERKQVSNLYADVGLGFESALQMIAPPAPKPAPEPDSFGGLSLVEVEPLPDISGIADTHEPEKAGTDSRWTRWRVQDMSSKGVGMIVDRAVGERVSLGQLIAVRPEGFQHYMIGVIVRKLTQRTLGETLIGVEILSYRPLSISLTRHANNHFDESLESVAPIPSLYLPNSDPVGKADILVLPAGDFGLKNVFDLQTKFFRYRVRINRVIRKGTDWIGLRFEVIDKQ